MSAQRFIKHPALPFAECRYANASDRHYKPHMHKTFCVGAMQAGTVVYRVDGRRFALQPGSLALINPETLHACNPEDTDCRSYYLLHLDLEWCLQVQQSLWAVERFQPVHTVLASDASLYRRFVTTMETFMGPADPLEKEQELVELMTAVFIAACEPGAVSTASPVQIAALKRELGRQLDADLSLRQLAQQFGANPYALLRQFKAATGITPHAYRLNCRIEHARTLLQAGVALAQVALDCGFCDQSHFHRHFKAATAVTPKAYQRNFIQ